MKELIGRRSGTLATIVVLMVGLVLILIPIIGWAIAGTILWCVWQEHKARKELHVRDMMALQGMAP